MSSYVNFLKMQSELFDNPVRMYTFLFKKKDRPCDDECAHCTSDLDSKVMQTNFMNCMGIFQMAMSVNVAVCVPILHEPFLI
jgi:hypothetical protein